MQREYDGSGYEPPARSSRDDARRFVIGGNTTGPRWVASIRPEALTGPAFDMPTEHR